ncbi:glycosyltransferase family 39 protein [Zoogloea sp.]|uniref:ArnT family glycosyltransferase n=1 Tax=Zoogloea sp. TaxID=49181 RepID=UPI00260924D9|nr:glycosyltransferase family 39 protein [Zoogloea sp.]MDD3354064.1 glycosyltransferase family 39 protein [Zoogloea sp.]
MSPSRSCLGPLALIAAVLTAYRLWVIPHLGIDLYVDEAYYWGWSQDLAWGYYSKPPVIAALIAASTTVLGNGLIAIKLPSLLLYPATAFVLYALGTRMYTERVGFWAGVAFLSMPLVAALGLFVSTDAPLLLCWSLALLFLLRALEREGWGNWLACGAVIGVGLMSKYTMAAFLPSALLLLALDPWHRRWLARPQPWIAVLLAFALLAPNLYWNWSLDFPTFRHTAEITRVGHGERGLHPGQLGEFIGAQWLSIGPILGLLLGWALLRSRRLWAERAHRTLLTFILPLLGLVSLQALTGRANGNWAAPVFVAACLLLPAVFLAERRRWLLAGIAFNLVAAMAVYHWPDIARATGTALTAKNDPYKRARGWTRLADALKPMIDAHPGYVVVTEDRELMAHLRYRLPIPEYATWHPAGTPVSHYDLVTTLRDKRGRNVLYIGRRPDITPIAERFEGSTPLGKVVVPIHKDFQREVHVFALEGFKGY